MKKSFCALLAVLVALILGARTPPAHAMDQFQSGFRHHGIRLYKIGDSARQTLRDYLAEEYHHQCPAPTRLPPDRCRISKPYYTSENLPARVHSTPLPEYVLRHIGYAPPGTAYLQIGHTVYLVRRPDKRIYDSVTLRDGER